MQQFCTYGSVRGATGNRRPYRVESRRFFTRSTAARGRNQSTGALVAGDHVADRRIAAYPGPSRRQERPKTGEAAARRPCRPRGVPTPRQPAHQESQVEAAACTQQSLEDVVVTAQSASVACRRSRRGARSAVPVSSPRRRSSRLPARARECADDSRTPRRARRAWSIHVARPAIRLADVRPEAGGLADPRT